MAKPHKPQGPVEVPYAKLRELPKAKPGSHNAFLQIFYGYGNKGNRALPLWLNDMTTDFSLTGATAQSAGLRDFYAHNFNQPAWGFSGQTHNEQEYGELVKFVRSGQTQCVFKGALMRLVMPTAGAARVWVKTPHGDRWVSEKAEIIRNLKGVRPGIALEGYIGTIVQRHERFIPSMPYQFAFIVSRHLAGPIRDEKVKPHLLPTSWNAFIQRDSPGFIVDPDKRLQQNKDDGKDDKPEKPYVLPPRSPNTGPLAPPLGSVPVRPN